MPFKYATAQQSGASSLIPERRVKSLNENSPRPVIMTQNIIYKNLKKGSSHERINSVLNPFTTFFDNSYF